MLFQSCANTHYITQHISLQIKLFDGEGSHLHTTFIFFCLSTVDHILHMPIMDPAGVFITTVVLREGEGSAGHQPPFPEW